jgi:hypothetical protein
MTGLSLAASVRNYPGGTALSALQARELARPCGGGGGGGGGDDVNRVHIDVAAAMTGVTRFLERGDGGAAGGGACPGRRWTYSRAEGDGLVGVDFAGQFTHLLSERAHVPGFRVAAVEQRYAGIQLQLWPPRVDVRTEPAIYVHANDNLF